MCVESGLRIETIDDGLEIDPRIYVGRRATYHSQKCGLLSYTRSKVGSFPNLLVGKKRALFTRFKILSQVPNMVFFNFNRIYEGNHTDTCQHALCIPQYITLQPVDNTMWQLGWIAHKNAGHYWSYVFLQDADGHYRLYFHDGMFRNGSMVRADPSDGELREHACNLHRAHRQTPIEELWSNTKTRACAMYFKLA